MAERFRNLPSGGLSGEGDPARSKALDLPDEAVDVVVCAEAGVAARRDLLRQVGEAQPEVEDMGVLLRSEADRRQPRFVQERPELVAGTSVVVAASCGGRADGRAAEDDAQAWNKVIGKDAHRADGSGQWSELDEVLLDETIEVASCEAVPRLAPIAHVEADTPEPRPDAGLLCLRHVA